MAVEMSESGIEDTVKNGRRRMPMHEIGPRYSAFPAISIVANLVTQEVVFRLASERRLAAAILAGAVIGFAAKYLLDKYFIFHDVTTTKHTELRKAVIHGLFSVLTTLIFWGSEFLFDFVWQTPFAKYSSAVRGLLIKYKRDNRCTSQNAGFAP